jgi:predicted transcriptional regulator
MTKKINVRFSNTLEYIQAVNGLFNLTEYEMKVLASIIDLDIPKEMDRFGTDARKAVAVKVGIPSTQMNMYVKKLVAKGAVRPKPYSVHPALIPADVVEVVCRRN